MRTIAWADFRGNRQYITNGHLSHDDRVALIFLDYPDDCDSRSTDTLSSSTYHLTPPRTKSSPWGSRDIGRRSSVRVQVRVTAYDWNCQQHIARYSADELAPILEDLHDQVAALQVQKADLQAKLDQVMG